MSILQISVPHSGGSLLPGKVQTFFRERGLLLQASLAGAGPRKQRLKLDLMGATRLSVVERLQRDLSVHLGQTCFIGVEGNACYLTLLTEPPTALHLMPYLRAARSVPHGQIFLGVSAWGQPVYCQLHEASHILMAGTTRSGKSTGMHSMLTWLLGTHNPAHLRLVLLDPKGTELGRYQGFPHLAAPILSDPCDSLAALRELYELMEARYASLKARGAQDTVGLEQEFPSIVVFVDEYADLLFSTHGAVEDLAAAIAGKGRAAGIHLVLATQRPSVNVVTGILKANFPTRIALQVRSKVDSRVILDQNGAETLLGSGDAFLLHGADLTNFQFPMTSVADAMEIRNAYKP